jgi:hypothetical protein
MDTAQNPSDSEREVGASEEFVVCKIWGFHDGDYEEWCLVDVTLCGSCKNRRFGGT